MYRIQPSTLSVASHFPRGLTTLGLAWIHGQLDAVALHKGEIAGSWHAPEPCEDFTRFADLVDLAVKQTGYQGSSIQLVLAHPRLAHQLVEIPDASGPALQPLVRRQVERLKVFEEAAAWAFEKAEPAKNAANALVHLLPQSILDQLSAAVEKAGYHLASVLPPTSILHAQLTRLPLGKTDVALLAADFGGSMTVVVGRRDSPLLLARSIDAARVRGAAALAVDLNRTLLYVSQQFGANVTGVWLFGAGLAGRIEELRPLLQIPVEVSPEEPIPQYWAQEVLRVPAEFVTNLVSAQQVRAPQRKALLKLSTALTATFLVTGLATAGWLTFRTRQEARLIEGLQVQVSQSQAQHRELQDRFAQLTSRERFVQQVLNESGNPVPLWFLAYLGEITPPEIAVTNLNLLCQSNTWHVRLSGRLQPSTTTSPDSLNRAVESFSHQLRTGPFQAQILTAGSPQSAAPPPASSLKSAVTAFADWASQIRSPAPKQQTPKLPEAFTLEALFQ